MILQKQASVVLDTGLRSGWIQNFIIILMAQNKQALAIF